VQSPTDLPVLTVSGVRLGPNVPTRHLACGGTVAGTEEADMGLMDKVKQVAGEMGEVAKKGASQVQTKVEQTQLRRKADDAAKRLGYLVHRERTGGDPAGAEADALVAEIKDAEEQIAAAETAAGSTTDVQGTEAPPPAPGPAVEEASE
jgi:hypothetical protein